MEYFFHLFNFFNCQKRNFWLWKIMVLLVVLTLANISCSRRRFKMDFILPGQNRPESNKRPYFRKDCSICGLTNPVAPQIIGGDVVQPQNRYPWMVSLLISEPERHVCGGSLISDSYILTAAHCLEGKFKDAKIGFLSPTSRVTPGYPTETVILHPKYERKDGGVYYDVGLIKLKKKITCDEYKNPVCLPPANARLPLKTALTITGWGRHSWTQKNITEALLQADVYVTDVKECSRTGNEIYCLKAKAVTQSACYGDSGGPSNYERNKKYFVMGVASFAISNCSTHKPFGYVNVASVMDWITKNTGVKPENFA